MAKTTPTDENRSKITNYNEEDMSETEEYFQNASRINSRQSSTSNFTQHNSHRDEGNVTIGVLPFEKDEYEEEFDDILLEAIDETLLSLGEPVKNAVYFHLLQNFKINKSEIPERINEFSEIIHKIFCSGACRLEIKFMMTLNSKINVDIQRPKCESPISNWIIMDISFTEYVHSMRKNYEAHAKKTLIPAIITRE